MIALMKHKIFNFGAGPAKLSEQVLKEAQQEFLDWNGTGMSILEIGHRTPEIMALFNHAELTLRQLIGIPSNYQVLFLGGAARTQFAMIPMYLLRPMEWAGYLDTGVWSSMALSEAQRLKNAYCIGSSEKNNYFALPEQNQWQIKKNTLYVYYTPNETVNGIRFPYIPSVNGLPLVADMTSCLLSEPIDVKKFGLIFAGVQKNISNAGMTIVIIRDDLLRRTPYPPIPLMFDYQFQAEQRSLYATPPVFNCYLAAKTFDWIKAEGGVEHFYKINSDKAARLYNYLDSTDFYKTSVQPEARSLVNVCFSINNPTLQNQFIKEADHNGLKALKGHRMVGGLRASIYNSMPMEGVEALIEFMKVFEDNNR